MTRKRYETMADVWLAACDRDIRAAAPKCARCGLPTAGISLGWQTMQEARLCACEKFSDKFLLTRGNILL